MRLSLHNKICMQDYEERTYEALNWVCAPKTPIEESSKAQTQTFLDLFSYLQDENSQSSLCTL